MHAASKSARLQAARRRLWHGHPVGQLRQSMGRDFLCAARRDGLRVPMWGGRAISASDVQSGLRDGRLAASRNADCLAEACIFTSQSHALCPSAVAALAVTSAPSSARHSHRVFPAASLSRFGLGFPCYFPNTTENFKAASLLKRRDAHPRVLLAPTPPAARQASSCIMHTHPAPCLLERLLDAADQIPSSFGQEHPICGGYNIVDNARIAPSESDYR